MLLEATHWTHLPVTGGWHEQHPQFVEEMMIMFEVKSEWEAEEERHRDMANNNNAAAREQALLTGVPVIH